MEHGDDLRLKPAVVLWLFLTALVHVPHLRAVAAPPAGSTFAGFLLFPEDQYNYLTFVQQAEAGAFRFRSKIELEPHRPALVNLEWWLVGRLSALLGGRPLVAYRLFALAASLALVLAVDHWLRHAGLPPSHRVPALVLVLVGGGFGGAAQLLGLGGPRGGVDLWTGAFPFVGLVANPHFTAGTALLLWTLSALIARQHVRGIVLGTALGLTRPYDLVLAGAVRLAAVVAAEPARAWPARLLPLLAFAPVGAYNYWVFYRHPAFSRYAAIPFTFPSAGELVLGLLPAAALAVLTLARVPSGRTWWVHLVAWTAIVGLVLAVRPVTFALQFITGIGVPLLALAALGLGRFRPAVLSAVAAAFSLSALVLVVRLSSAKAAVYRPIEDLAAVDALRRHCGEGDLALVPPELGLPVAGLTACRAYSAHALERDDKRRRGAARWFYDHAGPEQRALFLDGNCVRLVLAHAGTSIPRGRPTSSAAGARHVVYERAIPATCPAWNR